MTPRGIRNNNPCNIRRSSIVWRGQSYVQADPAFVTFDTPEDGIRAAGIILLHYEARGIRTLQGIISTWAPANENDTESYVWAVAHQMKVGFGTVLDLSQADEMQSLITAIIAHENGEQPYSDSVIQNGVSMALQAVQKI